MEKQKLQISSSSPVKSSYQESSLRRYISPSILASLILAIAGMGDAFLYAYLPVQGQALGLSAFIIGILLSINRFVRLLFNRWVAYASNHLGTKTVLRIGILVAGFTTLLYGFNPEIWIWIISRIFWGFSYAALRFATYQYAGIAERKGAALGWSRSIQELGAVVIYLAGPLLLIITGEQFVFLALSAITFSLLWLLPLLPEDPTKSQQIKALHFHLPDMTEIWIFLSSFLIEGFLIVSIAELLNVQTENGGLLALTAGYLSLRRAMNILLSPLSGWLCDVFTFRRVFHLSILIIVAGFIFIFLRLPAAGIIIVFVGSAINTTILPILALEHENSKRQFDLLTTMATSRDMGAASGTLIGLPLLTIVPYNMLFASIVVILISVWLSLRKFINAYE